MRDFNRYENRVLDWGLNTIMESRKAHGLDTDDYAAARIDLKLCDILFHSDTEHVRETVKKYVLAPTPELMPA